MNYAIVGNGVAGTKAADAIRSVDPDGTICILTEEAFPFYSRIRLIDFLAGEASEEDLVLRKAEWYREKRIELYLETRVAGVDWDAKELRIAAGGRLAFDRLLLATGGLSFVPPIEGADLQGVFSLRTLADAQQIRDHVGGGNTRVVLIGGGVLGLEAGNALRKSGCSIAVVEFFPRLLPRQMDPDGAAILQDEMEGMGFSFSLGAKTKEIVGKGQKVEAVVLGDGTRLPCDTVLVSAGVRPNAGLATALGLEFDKGVVVDDRMETSIPGLYAAGDLVQHRGTYYGIWPAAEKQGEIAGTNMAGGRAAYEGTTMSNMLKVAGIDLFAVGNIDPEGALEAAVIADRQRHVYKKLVFEGDRMVGAILYGDVGDRGAVMKAIQEQRTFDEKTRRRMAEGDFALL